MSQESPDSSEGAEAGHLVESTIQDSGLSQTTSEAPAKRPRKKRGPDKKPRPKLSAEARAKIVASRRNRPRTEREAAQLVAMRAQQAVKRESRAWSTFVLLWGWYGLQLRPTDR